MISRRSFTKLLIVAPAMLAARSPAFSEEGTYPSRIIQMVVGFPAGQASDVGARIIARMMGEDLKQTIYIENKAGAAGIIAHQYAKRATPDGYTLLYGSTGTLAINPALYKKLPYDPLTDFAPVVLLNSSPMFLATAAGTPVSDLKEMIAYVKAKPDQIAYGSSGNGTTQHIAMEMLKRETGMNMLHVPYKGSPPMVTDLIAGRIQFAFETSTAILPQADAGLIKLIGTSTSERSASAPDVPTLAEQGLPGFEALTWASLLVPAGTPNVIVEQLNVAANRALATKELINHYSKAGSTSKGGTPALFAEFLRQESAKWGNAVAASGVQVD